MGLDMYLYRVEKGAAPETRNEIAYWCMANAIHRWFIAGGVDNCEPILLHSEALPDLYDRCKRVLADHSLASELLPTQSGFFFGGTQYDDWYFSDLEDTVRMLEEGVINNPEARNCDIYYEASW